MIGDRSVLGLRSASEHGAAAATATAALVSRRRIYVMLGGLCALSVLGLVLVRRQVPSVTLEEEVVKALLQVVVVVVGGTAVKLLVDDHQLAQQRRERDRAELRSVLDEATRSYMGVKRARRLLRAEARSRKRSGYVVLAGPYDEQMRVINDHQLELETLAARLKTTAVRSGLRKEVCEMEDYLQGLVKEFERRRPTFSGRPACCDLTLLPGLEAFLGTSEIAFDKFSERFHKLEDELRADLRATYER